MEQNHQHQSSAQHQVVANLKTPAVKASGGQVARFNAGVFKLATT